MSYFTALVTDVHLRGIKVRKIVYLRASHAKRDIMIHRNWNIL